MNSALMVLLVRVGIPDESEPYAKGIREILRDQDGAGGRELLQVTELREFQLSGAPDPASQLQALSLDFLASCDRLLVVILDAQPVAERAISQADLTDFETAVAAILPSTSAAAPRVLSVYLKEKGSLFGITLADSRIVRLGLEDLDERDLRIAFLTLYTLHHALSLFTPAGNGLDKPARLFFSHAKRDGVPLTTATKDWMGRLKGFSAFYDTTNLDIDGDIDAQLNNAVRSAIVIVFRSDVFDQRYWCQKEVLWADQHSRPVITVDARWQVEHGPSVISFDSTPTVRIPDGSVVRIFMAALIEALRVELFTSRVKAHALAIASGEVYVVPVPRRPSLVSLHGACAELQKQIGEYEHRSSYIVYPNPAIPQLMHEAAQKMVECVVNKNCQVLALDEFRLVY